MRSSTPIFISLVALLSLFSLSLASPAVVHQATGKRCATGRECPSPLSCVGNEGNKKCFMRKGLGMACGKDPFWVCFKGLRCIKGVCVKAIKQGGRCNNPGDVCQEGLSCVGNLGNKKCFMRKAVGMECGKDPFWVCRHGLRCRRGKCVRAISQAGSCDDPGSVCAEGLSCVGNPGNKKCFMRKPVGMRCGQDPFWVCRHGLRCFKGVCARTEKVGGACNEPGTVCPEGTSCLGNKGNRKCFARKAIGMRCGQDPFWVCRSGLRCAGGICKA